FNCAIDGFEGVLSPPVHGGLNFFQRCDVAANGFRRTIDGIRGARRNLLLDGREPTFVLGVQLPQLREQLVQAAIGSVSTIRLSLENSQLVDKGADTLLEALERSLPGGERCGAPTTGGFSFEDERVQPRSDGKPGAARRAPGGLAHPATNSFD